VILSGRRLNDPPWLAVVGWAALAASLGAAVLAALHWSTTYVASPGFSDFKIYYLAARIGIAHGWQHMYDPRLQDAGWKVLGYDFSQQSLPDRLFLSPPLVAWIATPFTVLPPPAAYLAWSVLTIGCLALTWWLLAPGTPLWRSTQLLASLWIAPVLFGLMLGQAAFLVLAAVAACWWLLRHDRPSRAGLVLTLIWIKPNLAFLVPPMLLLLSERRAMAAWLAASLGLALIVGLVVGTDGLATYLHELMSFAGRSFNTAATVAQLTPTSQGAHMLEAGLGGLALFAGWRQRRRGLELPLAAAIAGSLLASPYLHPYDFTMLLASVWLVLRGSPPRWLAWAMLLAIPAAELLFTLGSLPLLAFAAGLVVAVALVPTMELRRRGSVTELESAGRA
jgi:Glycosyltransferase family 87